MYPSQTFSFFFYLLLIPKLISPALPSFPSLDSDMHMAPRHVHLDGHRGIMLTTSSLTESSYTIPRLIGTSVPPSIWGWNPMVNLHSTHPAKPPQYSLFYFLNISQIHLLLFSSSYTPFRLSQSLLQMLTMTLNDSSLPKNKVPAC